MSRLWYRCWHWLCTRIYFERVTVLHPERLPKDGPVLYVGLHRNGAVDGFVYHQLAPRGVFLISTQLLRSFFGRLFFSGIAVARKQDEEDRTQNEAALSQCTRLLADGGQLIILPEGTSSLGPRHLPFKAGAAGIAVDAMARGVPLRIVPLGIHYERAWAFRSRVEVVVGESIPTEMSAGLSELGRIKELKRRMTTALESVGVNFPSAEAQLNAERFAYAMTLGTPRSYFDSLKSLESRMPGALLAQWNGFSGEIASRRVLFHQGVPLFPAGSCWLYALPLLLLGPIVLAGALLNLPPALAAWLAARRFADGRNVIALWRILVGLPVFLLWFSLVAASLAVFAGWSWSVVYALVSLLALKSVYRAKKLAVTVWNGLAHRDLIGRAHEFHHAVMETVAEE
ncbi:MAG: 1-acyl-sn-glycerol-3-phosphate acyltransferase [Planctomycetota bacterium]